MHHNTDRYLNIHLNYINNNFNLLQYLQYMKIHNIQQGSIIHMPYTIDITLFEGTNETNITCFHNGFYSYVDRITNCDGERTIIRSLYYINLSIIKCLGLLRISINSISISYCNFKIYLARNNISWYNMDYTRIDLGHTGIIHFHWPVCKERTKIIGSVSSVFLLLIIRLVNSVILGYFIYKEEVSLVIINDLILQLWIN